MPTEFSMNEILENLLSVIERLEERHHDCTDPALKALFAQSIESHLKMLPEVFNLMTKNIEK